MELTALDALLRPRSVAVVGASDRGSVGGRIFRNMRASGFKGPIWPINPNHEWVGDVRCWPDIESLPKTPDCVAIAVPEAAVFEPLEAAAARGVPAAVVVADGFADAGTAAGRRRQARLSALAHSHGMAISGPNSMGIVGLAHPFAAAFTNLPKGLRRGGVSVVSQSGGLINAVLELALNRGLGFNYLISGGNEAAVGSADYIGWLADDPGTSIIVNIIEGVSDGRAYRRALARAAAKKPVVVLKLGRTEAGRAAALAHTGSLAGSEAAYRSVFRECGAAHVTTVDAMIESACLLSTLPPPRGDRVFVFSVSGGASVLAGDLARKAGLKLPPLSRKTSAALGRILGVDRAFTNPMDVVGAPRLVAGDNLTRCLRVLDRDPAIDAVALVMVVQREVSESHRVLHRQFHDLAPRLKTPVAMVSEMTWHPSEAPAAGGPPIAGTLDHGLRALKHAINHAAYRRRAAKAAPGPKRLGAPLALDLPVGRPLTEPESAALLEDWGLPFARWEFATSTEAAARAATRIGFPVAVKGVTEGLAHKTEAGVVHLGLRSGAAVRRACAAISNAFPRAGGKAGNRGFLVQEMVAGGVEMILGAKDDPQFGPLVLVGAGGTLAELVDDVEVALAPVGHREAAAMIGRLKAAKLLRGWRGAPPCDYAALARLVASLSRFAARSAGKIAEIDLNPVMVLPKGQGVRIVDALVVPGRTGTSS